MIHGLNNIDSPSATLSLFNSVVFYFAFISQRKQQASIMKTSTILLAFVCAVSLRMAMGGAEEMQECVKGISSKMQEYVTKAMSGGDMSSMKDEICPFMKDFVKCAMKASSDKRPSDAEMDELKKEVAQASSQMQGIDCQINFDQLADEVWNAAGVARPLSIVALVVAAIAAMIASN
ncbi:hypothetical protein RRG08_061205 [Elysia crispata]|uniref:Uncharacterized protein n=1 Tax=Elysia crispata TaxID=231223 RepID=A0AAE0ZNM2_9GAST|nr:hypothetical protein RRG08_061205 [Elysia crispata]